MLHNRKMTLNRSNLCLCQRPPKPEIRPLDDYNLKNYLPALENDSLAPILKFIVFTGLRESEALGLDVYDHGPTA